MSKLDQIDIEILEHLVDDGRTPYSTIADAVGLSAPAVSSRVDRLEAAGVIEHFTININTEQMQAGITVLIRIYPASDALPKDIGHDTAVEHRFVTATGDVICTVRVRTDQIRAQIQRIFDLSLIDTYEVEVLDTHQWHPAVRATGFTLTCAECGNTVTAEGDHAEFGGERHEFCCDSCLEAFESRYHRLQESS